jgi:hypothetical protein
MKHPQSKHADLANKFDRLKQSATPFRYDVAAASGPPWELSTMALTR